ncbi:Hypothetical predicted protein [Olea europaea subsp. europaea]|uniref:Uncharacterized protein n=1 Tax=Olea europaea subsp. europaea TaxID=158383 RepID=A0A8S0PIB5_OLEEU|nr:Hypothetical predicted protein [Olea europaea subsp. europaea]
METLKLKDMLLVQYFGDLRVEVEREDPPSHLAMHQNLYKASVAVLSAIHIDRKNQDLTIYDEKRVKEHGIPSQDWSAHKLKLYCSLVYGKMDAMDW